jgi:gamma-glutamyltranspeptidase / glutathione hydrolase
MVAGSSNPFAVHAGLDALKQGGSAADAALTTSLAQIALLAGATVSYAGIMTAVYYDASSGKVSTLNAAFNTVKNERWAFTIPRMGKNSGRTALVPGFMAGVQALHDRFGKLPFARLLDPAIRIAENGFALSPAIGKWTDSQRAFITRLPETKRIFTKDNGEIYQAGDVFRQPELAATLRKVARDGSGYMYAGEWAHHFVSAVQREGGKLTLQDLAAYRALWTEPIETTYRDYQLVSLEKPNTGGLQTLGCLKVAEAAGLKKYGHYTDSAEALYYLTQIARIQSLPSLTEDAAQRRWAQIRNRGTRGRVAGNFGANHLAGVLAVDQAGNVASVVHSINSVLWGSTGIFVDGISVPDSAAFQQYAIFAAGRSARLPDPTNPLLVLKDGKPVLASSTIGVALYATTLQNLLNILDFGMDPKTAVDQPNTRGPYFGMNLKGTWKPEYAAEAVGEGDFSESVLDGVRARGQPIKIVPQNEQAGHWIGIQIDPQTRELKGGVTSKLNALVEGY